MNERINELRLDAGISLLHDEPYLVAVNKSGNIEDPMIGLEKFAELIVAECIDNIEVWELDSRNHISYMLARHFGVEK